jgi:hypothetical protein
VKQMTKNTTGDYNIWYHAHSGPAQSTRATFVEGEERLRCVPERDTGKTRAKDATTPLCSHFARGCCVLGHKCQFRHQIPTADDERRLTITRDIFGRERHAEDKADMSGAGSFSKNNRTLYVGNLAQLYPTQQENESMLRRHFEPYGELEYCRIIPGKNCGFVRYCFRASAEFAKLAMDDGYLDNGNEVIEVRWAHEDPNPLARLHEQRQRQLEFINAVQSKIAAMPADQAEKKRSILTLQALQRGQYPNTDDAFAQSAGAALVPAIGPTMPPAKRPAPAQVASASTALTQSSTAAAAAEASESTASTAVISVAASSDGSVDAAAVWAAMTPEQQQATWLAYYAQHGGKGRADATATAAATAAAAAVDADSDDTRPVHLTEAYYNTASGGFYMPNPVTNEAHPYAYGRYRRTDEQQADFDRGRKEAEQRRMQRAAGGAGGAGAAGSAGGSGSKRSVTGQVRR